MVRSFLIGSTVYSKTGSSYIVDEVADNIIYCTSHNGVEHDFSSHLLYTEEEWNSSKNPILDVIYANIKVSSFYNAKNFRIPLTSAEKFLTRCETLIPNLIDYVSYFIARSYIIETNKNSQNILLSKLKCRQIFEDHAPDVKSVALSKALNINPLMISNLAELGENGLMAILNKGLEAHVKEYQIFCSKTKTNVKKNF